MAASRVYMEDLEGPGQRGIFLLLPEGAFLQTVFAQFSSQRHIPDSLAVQRINKDYGENTFIFFEVTIVILITSECRHR